MRTVEELLKVLAEWEDAACNGTMKPPTYWDKKQHDSYRLAWWDAMVNVRNFLEGKEIRYEPAAGTFEARE